MRSFNKLFGIGKSRTGTSSLHKAFEILGIDSIHRALSLTEHVKYNIEQGFEKLLYGIDGHKGFTDHPIDWLYKQLDEQYPGSLFIYTKRDDWESWLESMHSLPYHLKFGEIIRHDDRINEEGQWLDWYRYHERIVREHFKGRDDYLEIDITQMKDDSWEPICTFLEVDIPNEPFPHVGKAEEIILECCKC